MLADATLLNLETTKVVILLAMACGVGCFAVVQMRLLAAPFRRLKAGPRHMCAALAALMLVCLVWAQKSGDGGDDGDSSGGTNDVTQVSGTNDTDGAGLDGMGPLMMMGSIAPDLSPVIDAADIARGYRLESSTVNGQISYEMPEGVSPAGTWHLTGAYDDVLSVDLNGFVFPLGRELCSSLWAHTWGTARPHLRNQTNELVAVGAPMSAVPGVSRFWTVQTTNDTFLLTWESFTLGRIPVSTNASSLIPDPSSLLSAQLELFRSGDFIARSNNVESVYRRINPDDWDNDGYLNEVDPVPTVFNEDGFGPHQDLSVIAYSNNYYWVDLVVSNSNATVTFTSELPSNLDDPVFIARAGDTNRVVLLLGKPYEVECLEAMEIVNASHEDVVFGADGWGRVSVCRPVECIFVGDQTASASPRHLMSMGCGGRSLHLDPEPEGCSVSWNDNFCCVETLSDGLPRFQCDGTCGCGGCSTGDITVSFEGTYLTYGGIDCGCSRDEPDPGPDTPLGEPVGPSVSASFSKYAIMFEDAYENAPGQWFPRRSTEAEATFYVYGGTNGGSYAFSLQNGTKLRRVGGSYLPRCGTVHAGESFTIKVRFEAESASGSEYDIHAVATFTENGTGTSLRDDGTITAVEVRIESVFGAKENECVHRHRFGVCEQVHCVVIPQNVSRILVLRNGATEENPGYVRLPLAESQNPFDVRCGNVIHTPYVTVVEPVCVQAYQPGCITFGVMPFCAGGIGLTMNFQILPLDVSFQGISIEEVPSTIGVQTGYFTHPYFNNVRCHSRENGAGVWSMVGVDNITYGRDTAGQTQCLPRMTEDDEITNDPSEGWKVGSNIWSVPFGWNISGTTGSSEAYKAFAANTVQVFTMDVTGTAGVSKLNNEAVREISGNVFFNGERVW